MAECHIGFEKVLRSLFKFRATKNIDLLNSLRVSQYEELESDAKLRRQKTMVNQLKMLKF